MSPRIIRNALVGLILGTPLLVAQPPKHPHATNLFFTDSTVELETIGPGTHVFVFPSELQIDGQETVVPGYPDVERSPEIPEEVLDDTSVVSVGCVGVGVCRDPGHPTKPLIQRPGDINRADDPPRRYHRPGDQRAGRPNLVARWARCSTDSRYSGGFVGGGVPLGGLARRCDAGTWGVDYHGWLSPRFIFLNWTCGCRQGGEGAYQTDGEPPIVNAAKDRLHHP